ncbi:hypothetical protein ACFFX0_17150 [Citricoccus parietis]|uniref:Uncharacterized protein n=1 Tax=Citricoccus parietis TaxID=592307 RepID=A0ABV5G1M1_9MICC
MRPFWTEPPRRGASSMKGAHLFQPFPGATSGNCSSAMHCARAGPRIQPLQR